MAMEKLREVMYWPLKIDWKSLALKIQMGAIGSWPPTTSSTAMRILNWNYRGLGKSSTVLQCQKKAHKSKLDLMFLMKTRLPKDRGKQVWDKCGFVK